MPDPTIEATDGHGPLTGTGYPNWTVTVADGAGNVLGTPRVDASGNWSLSLNSNLPIGTVIRMAQTDDADVTRTAETTVRAGAVDPSNVNTKYTVTEGAKIADGVEAHAVT
ncbi:Ig-like domain-containing protein, partial [Acaricomes phytoseiuli]|uniref:Ig-like domain-containing protein n=1 Tax=Acaricomes phytoseiuli TaxID=291968 RepID=UPI001B7FBED8